MVAHLLRLKLVLLRNGLRRAPAAVIGMVLGLVYGGGFVVAAAAVLVALRLDGDAVTARTVVVLGGTALMAGWAILPVVLFGIDPTLDPARFATFAVPRRRLALGLALTGLVGLPGVATMVLLAAMVVTVSRSAGAVLVGALAAVAAVAACVLGSRIVTGLAAAVLASRRGRDVAGFAGFLVLLSVGPAVGTVGNGGPSLAVLRSVADVVAWTPLGWAFAAAGDAGVGSWGSALVRLTLAFGWCAALFMAWERVLAEALGNPRSAGASGAGGGGGGHAGLGLFARLPGTPRGAIAARAGTYWVRDPRFNLPALMTILLPAGLLVAGAGSHSVLALTAMPVASAYLIGWGQHNDVGYDSTAFWMHVASGVDGRSDRLGRLFPSGLIAAVCVPGYAVVGVLAGAPWRMFPAMLGAGVGVALNGFAVACVTSAVKQYAVPAPGENPFTSRPGSVGVTMAVQTLCGIAVVTLSVPVLALAVLAWFGPSWASGAAWAPWAALVVGPALGLVTLAVGVRVGARLFARRQADLLTDLVSMR